MADKVIKLANFKYGLDSRRADLASQPGTLQQCENAYINAGGEADKRLAFYNAGVLFPDNTFWVQDVETGLETYGSDAEASGPLPDGVEYIQLVSPTGAAMVGIVDSCNANGKSFVIAEFDDGNVFCYYDGELVDSSRNGLVLDGATSLSDLAIECAAQINAIGLGWIGIPNVDEHGNVLIGAVVVKSPSGTTFDAIPNDAGSVDGVIGYRFVDKEGQVAPESPVYDADGQITAGTKATAKFLIGSVGSVGNVWVLSAPQGPDVTGEVELCTVTVAAETPTQLATAIAAVVNANTFITEYTAESLGTTVFIHSALAWGADANTFQLTVDSGDGTTAVTPVASSFVANVTPSGIDHTTINNSSAAISITTTQSLTASATGGTQFTVPPAQSPYTFLWEWVSQTPTAASPADQIVAKSPTSATTKFKSPPLGFGQISAVFKCTVTDAIAANAYVYVAVTISHESNL